MADRVMSSQSIADRITQEGWNYLVAGDIAWTNQGKSLQDMFALFGSEDDVVRDFAAWLLAKTDEKPSSRQG